MRLQLILGGPGTGKTSRLLQLVEDQLDQGVEPEEIAFVAFTNAAADEAKGRAVTKFNLDDDALVHFRTIHSLCFRALGLHPNEVLKDKHLQAISALTGEYFTVDPEGPPQEGKTIGDRMLFVMHYARSLHVSLQTAWQLCHSEFDWFRLQRFSTAYEAYKEESLCLDFTDMLTKYMAEGRPVPVRVAIIDEAQDLTPLQWAVVEKAFSRAELLVIAGDDDQAVHCWAGADMHKFLNLGVQPEVLAMSHRLPRVVFELGQKIIGRVEQRYAKPYRPTGLNGLIVPVNSLADVDMRAAHGSWLVLARNNYQLEQLEQIVRDQAMLYTKHGKTIVDPLHVRCIKAYEDWRKGLAIGADDTALVLRYMGVQRSVPEGRSYKPADLGIDAARIWHDALEKMPLDDREYYLLCLRRGEKLLGTPRVRLDTIHGAKGLEADNVAVELTMSPRNWRSFEVNPDPEHRVFYTAVTRTKSALYTIEPRGTLGYPF